MTKTELAGSTDRVKAELNAVVAEALADLSNQAREGSQRTLELATWAHLLAIGKVLLAYAFTLRCLRSTEADVERRGLTLGDVDFRADASYQATLTTTVGPVTFPMCAYRDYSRPLPVTRTPARADFLSCYRRCRSSELCIAWETRLGTDLPFRTAQDTLAHFTHGAVRLEDTTVARHMVAVGAAITRGWLYRTPEQIAEILDKRATCDLETKRPVVYASSDAVALRRYVDETWAAEWKMANGLRLWCIDRVSGATVHLGGEYTFGDCQVVEAAVVRLIESGHLPRNAHYPAVHAQIVFVTDGMPWLEDRIINHFTDAIAILDLYHALEHAAAYASTLHRKGSAAAKQLYARAARALLGQRRRTRHENTSPR